MATTVVPWGTSSEVGAAVTAAPGSWWGLTRRRSSANEGPGSACAANSGNGLRSDIRRGPPPPRAGARGDGPLPRDARELLDPRLVGHRRGDSIFAVLELADTDVAVPAEN